MSYQYTILSDKPAAFWMITASSGSTETDLSGNGFNATITEATDLIDRGYRSLVTDTSTGRAFRFYDDYHKVTYPALEIWETGRDHIPFSIEFTVQPTTTNLRSYIFAPQNSSGALEYDNGIYIEDNSLYFATSNGGTSPSTIKTIASYPLPAPNQSYHVVAIYGRTKIYLYVDGQLVDEEVISSGQLWGHTNNNFITMSQRDSANALKSEFLLDAVSVFKYILSPDQIKRHYVMSTPNISDLEIVNGLGGKLFNINSQDRVKHLNFSALDNYGWTGGNVVTKDVDVLTDRVALKKIPPVVHKTTPINYGNLLSPSQSTFEGTAVTGWGVTYNPGTLTYTQSLDTAQTFHGSQSLKTAMTSGTGVAQFNIGTPFPASAIPVTGGEPVVVSTEIRCSAARTFSINASYYDANNTYISSAGSSNTAITANTWTLYQATHNTPTNALYAIVEVACTNPSSGDNIWIDAVGYWRGASLTWNPSDSTTFVPNQDITIQPKNRVTYNQATVEIDLTGMSNTSSGGPAATMTRDTAKFSSGSASVKFAVTGSCTVSLTTSTVPVIAGRTYTHMVKGIGSSARSLQQYVNFFDSGNNLITNGGASSVTLSTSAWTQVSRTVVAPARAVKADIYTQIPSALNTENYWFDEIGMFEGSVSSWSPPPFDGNIVKLYQSQYAQVANFGRYTSGSYGGFGGYVKFSSTENDNVQEQVVFSAINSKLTSLIEVVKKSDKNLYLRFGYKDYSGNMTLSEASWGAISSLLSTTAYIYVEFANDVINLYVNSTSSPAQVFVTTVMPPQFDDSSTLTIGAGWDKTRCWNNNFSWIKIYSAKQDTNDFYPNMTSVNGFTWKCTNAAGWNVSQQGSARLTVPTGGDGTVSMTESQINWWPYNSGVQVYTGVYDQTVPNMLTYNQATIDVDTTGWSAVTNSTIARSYNPGLEALMVTSVASGDMAASTLRNASAVPISPNTTYTAIASFRTASAARSCKSVITWYGSTGTQLSQSVSTSVVDSTSGWTQAIVTATSPSNAYFASSDAYIYSTGGAAEVHYVNNVGLFRGTAATWVAPDQVASFRGEIVPDVISTTTPQIYYVRAVLSTDDSYYDETYLRDINLSTYTDSGQYSENSWDQLIFDNYKPRIFTDTAPMVRQNAYSGAYVGGGYTGRFGIFPVDDTANTAIPDGGSGASTAGASALYRTVEFWLYPEVQGYYFLHTNGATEYSMRYYDSGGFTTSGFTTLYVDGTATSNAATSTTWYNRWHHIILTNSSTQLNFNLDGTANRNLLTPNQAGGFDYNTTGIQTADGSPTVTRQTSLSGGGAACVQIVTTATGLNAVAVVPRFTCVPGEQISAIASFRSAAVTTSARVYVTFFTKSAGFVTSLFTNIITTTTSSWTQATSTVTVPEGAATFDIRPAWTAIAAIGETHYVDLLGIFKGSNTTFSSGVAGAWFGLSAGVGNLATARFQNIAYYPQTFDSTMVTNNYKAYLGDTNGASITDAPGGRTLTDTFTPNPFVISTVWDSTVVKVR